MTRKEAKDVFLNRGFIEIEGCRGRIFNADKWREACVVISEWLTSLEQEPIIDKIRAEIWDLQYGDEEKSMTDEDRADAYNNAIKQVIEIIDKYKAESEDNK